VWPRNNSTPSTTSRIKPKFHRSPDSKVVMAQAF
jgi:hypothetical protein